LNDVQSIHLLIFFFEFFFTEVKNTDPYVTLRIGKTRKVKTQTLKQTKTPEWHQDFTLYVISILYFQQ
jgi:hypothetical protein